MSEVVESAGKVAEPAWLVSLREAEALGKEKRYAEAEAICNRLLGEIPELPGAMGLLGGLKAQQGEVEVAIGFLERAVARQPNAIGWWDALCALYRIVHRLEEAIAAGRRAVQAQSDNARYLFNLGRAHQDHGDNELALTFFLAALARQPDDPESHLAVGQILLARGEMRPGWIEYEWRNRLEMAKGRLPGIRAPVWNGMKMPAGRILLIADQGFGDAMQFVRYIPMVRQYCDEVLLACSRELVGLFEKVEGVGRCFQRWQDVPGFSAWGLLSSLPFVFGTEMDTIPGGSPYLTPDPERVELWRQRFAAALPAGGLRVGVVWTGRPTHPNDRRRSVALDRFLPLADIPGVRLVSLQVPVPEAEKQRVAEHPKLLDLSADLTDFAETGAIMRNLDLVVSIDSAVAHLAGALGVPIWVVMPRPADWRWMLDRADTPWYPSMRLFRQPRPGDWDSVFAELIEAARARVAGEGLSASPASDRAAAPAPGSRPRQTRPRQKPAGRAPNA